MSTTEEQKYTLDDYDRYMNEDGTFNPLYSPQIQILGKPQPDEDPNFFMVGFHKRKINLGAVPEKITAFYEREAVTGFDWWKEKILGRTKENIRNDVGSVFHKVCTMQPVLWTPRNMHGAEYENGQFQTDVAWAAVSDDLITAKIDVDVNTEMRPRESQLRHLKKPERAHTFRQKWNRAAGIELPEKIPTTVYVIGPKDTMSATKDFINKIAGQEQEIITHRGLGFNPAVAYQTLTEDQQKAVGMEEDVAWFISAKGVFFTIDKDMFENAKVAFGLEDAPKPVVSPGAPVRAMS